MEVFFKHYGQNCCFKFRDYQFDLKDTIYFFSGSRYEFRAKGLDMFIESLGTLNKMLEGFKFILFFWVI